MRVRDAHWGTRAARTLSRLSGRGRRAGVAALMAAAVTGATLAPTAATAATAPTTVSSPSGTTQAGHRSGVYSGAGDVAGVRAFEAWRGAPVGVVTDFVDASSWATIADPSWVSGRWKGTGYHVAYGVPMLPDDGAGSLQEGATGAYNVHFQNMARVLVANGSADAVLRLGWEMNGSWFRWSAVQDPAAYVAYWRTVVDAIRRVPGAAFRFEWAPNLGEGTWGFDKSRAYPGDAYVDIIGVSAYDQSWAFEPAESAKRWNELVTTRGGLQWHVDFAAAHGKPNALSEWALSQRCDGNGGDDDPYYIEQVGAWVERHDYYYESYFDYRTGSCEQHSITEGDFPLSRQAYLGGFPIGTVVGAPAPITPLVAAPPPPPAPVDGSVLKVSWSSSRSNPANLAWMGVTTRVYIFAAPPFAATKVSFYLDDPGMTRAPMTVDTGAPFDLVGGTATTAVAFDGARLTAGKHTLTALFDTPQGAKVAQVTFLR